KCGEVISKIRTIEAGSKDAHVVALLDPIARAENDSNIEQLQKSVEHALTELEKTTPSSFEETLNRQVDATAKAIEKGLDSKTLPSVGVTFEPDLVSLLRAAKSKLEEFNDTHDVAFYKLSAALASDAETAKKAQVEADTGQGRMAEL